MKANLWSQYTLGPTLEHLVMNFDGYSFLCSALLCKESPAVSNCFHYMESEEIWLESNLLVWPVRKCLFQLIQKYNILL